MLAGAGTGKTKALTARIVHLLTTGRARPNEILAGDLHQQGRARDEGSRRPRCWAQVAEGMPWMGTFHSLSVKILRRHAELVGLKSNFTILDTDDQLRLLKQLIAAANIDEKRWPARMLAGLIDGWKNRALTPDQVPSSEASAYNNRGTELYDALSGAAEHPERHRFRRSAAALRDDLPDPPRCAGSNTSAGSAIFWWTSIRTPTSRNTCGCGCWRRRISNICCVGDDDQSIYGWRGAEVGNILRFEKDFPGAKVVRLEQNYRSTAHILAAASGVIAANAGRLGKTLWTEARGRREGAPDRPLGRRGRGALDRRRGRGDAARHAGHGPGRPERHQAILVRASHQMRAFEDRFLTIGLPYRVIGGPRFYERQEIRDAMAYFRLAVSPEDDLAFERVVNLPKRGLGDKAQQDIQREARAQGCRLLDGARGLLAAGASAARGRAQLRGLCRRGGPLASAPRCDAGLQTISRLAEMILEESGYTAMWQNDKTPEAPGRLENLKELVKALEQFDNLQGFLEHVSA